MSEIHGGRPDEWVDRIYLAGVRPHSWPELLDALAKANGARGANLIRQTSTGAQFISTPAVADVTAAFASEGWNEQNTRVSRLMERFPYAGFLTDSDLHSRAELASLPMYTEFLTPRGAAAGAATIIPGANDDGIVVAFEAFADHETSRRALPRLDALRPHIARAMVLSNEVEAVKARSVLESFEAMRFAVALVGAKGDVVGANEPFREASEGFLRAGAPRLTPHHARSRRQFEAALAMLQATGQGDSLVIHNADETASAVLHLVPCWWSAENPFSTVAAFAVLSKPGNKSLPTADIVATLFDLTPAEALVARAIAGGRSPKEVARDMGISFETVRTHLKRVFQKASVSRQSQLTALLAGF